MDSDHALGMESIMGWGRYDDYGYPAYVSVAKKLAMATKRAAEVAKKQGRKPSPVKLVGKKIATTFWGQAWCDNLVAYSDFASRLPRGATYVRNGSVVDLVIKPRSVEAIVAGSETYTITIEINPLASPAWKKIKQDCSAEIDSLLDLLAGRFSDGVMQRLTRPKDGLFPAPHEIKMTCSCPDWSDCCKHLAAVMYGIGARLDRQPELLFLLRNVDHQELINHAVTDTNLDKELKGGGAAAIADQDLGAIFGIELDTTSLSASPSQTKAKRTSKKKPAARKTPTKKPAVKKPPAKKAVLKKAPKPSVAKPSRPSRAK